MQGQGSSKLDQVKAQVKEFSIDTFRTTKQLFSEMMGKGTRTVDPKVDGECQIACVLKVDSVCQVACVPKLDGECQIVCVPKVDGVCQIACVPKVDGVCQIACVLTKSAYGLY